MMIVKRTRMLFGLAVAALLMAGAALVAAAWWPLELDEMPQTVTMVEESELFTVVTEGGDTLFLRPDEADTALVTLCSTAKEAAQTSLCVGCWARRWAVFGSENGRMVVANHDDWAEKACRRAEKEWPELLRKECRRMRKAVTAYSHELSEMDYWLRVHGVNDEGYSSVWQHSERLRHAVDSISAVLAVVEKADSTGRAKVIRNVEYSLLTFDKQGKEHRTTCHKLSADGIPGLTVIATADGKTADGARAVCFHRLCPWHMEDGDEAFVASLCGISTAGFSPSEARSALTPTLISVDSQGKASHDLPAELAPDGSPVISKGGQTLGITLRGHIVPERKINQLLRNTR